jgi:nitrate reductase assembly molybdenum cofactor insertion protein NarJ
MDCGQRLQALRCLLARPEERPGPSQIVTREILPLSPAAAEEVARFDERVADLSLAERQELFDETFTGELNQDVRQLVRLLEGGLPSAAEAVSREAEVIGVLARAAERLRRDRNPYHHLFQALLRLTPVP